MICARIKANMLSTKQNSHKYVFDKTKYNQGKNMLPQTFARNVAFTQILNLLNILLFQNTVDCVCLVIQRYSRKEKKSDIQSHNISPIRCCFPFHDALFNNFEHICQVLKIVCWFSVNNICQKMIFTGKKHRWASTDEKKKTDEQRLMSKKCWDEQKSDEHVFYVRWAHFHTDEQLQLLWNVLQDGHG